MVVEFEASNLSFGLGRDSLHLAWRPNSSDSLCHVIDSCDILGSTRRS